VDEEEYLDDADNRSSDIGILLLVLIFILVLIIIVRMYDYSTAV
jgi:hypothetical protein